MVFYVPQRKAILKPKCVILNFQGKIPHHAAVISITRVVPNEFSYDVTTVT